MNSLFAIKTFIFGEDAYLGGGRYGPVTQPQLEFVFVRIGAVDVDVDGKHCLCLLKTPSALETVAFRTGTG